jgi:HAD superfamily hydrolase (TIGR01509 family)
VIFDLDGLLVDSEPLQARAINGVMARYGIRLGEEEFTELVGTTTRDNFVLLKARYGLPESVDELLAAKSDIYLELVKTDLKPCEGAVELVRAFRAMGVPLAVASSSPGRDVRLSLEAVGIAGCFAHVVSAEDAPHPKPAPDLYLEAVRRLGARPEECVAFEDSGAGVRAAASAGIACYAVPHRYTRDHDFSAAVAVLGSLSDVQASELIPNGSRG